MSPDQKILIERVKDSNLHYRITPKLAAPQVARPYSYLGEVPVTTPAPEDRQVNVVTSEPVPNRHPDTSRSPGRRVTPRSGLWFAGSESITCS